MTAAGSGLGWPEGASRLGGGFNSGGVGWPVLSLGLVGGSGLSRSGDSERNAAWWQSARVGGELRVAVPGGLEAGLAGAIPEVGSSRPAGSDSRARNAERGAERSGDRESDAEGAAVMRGTQGVSPGLGWP